MVVIANNIVEIASAPWAVDVVVEGVDKIYIRRTYCDQTTGNSNRSVREVDRGT